jgi:hypothetical protein
MDTASSTNRCPSGSECIHAVKTAKSDFFSAAYGLDIHAFLRSKLEEKTTDFSLIVVYGSFGTFV